MISIQCLLITITRVTVVMWTDIVEAMRVMLQYPHVDKHLHTNNQTFLLQDLIGIHGTPKKQAPLNLPGQSYVEIENYELGEYSVCKPLLY